MTAPAHRSRTPSPELGLTIVFALAFAVWTWLVLRGSLHDLDARLRALVFLVGVCGCVGSSWVVVK